MKTCPIYLEKVPISFKQELKTNDIPISPSRILLSRSLLLIPCYPCGKEDFKKGFSKMGCKKYNTKQAKPPYTQRETEHNKNNGSHRD